VKARKFFGVLFTILGAMTAFLSIAVLILPLIANDQTRLVLDSFYQPSDNPLVNLMNSVLAFMTENGTLTLALGAGLLLTGILLLLSAARLEEERAAKRRSAQRKVLPSSQPVPQWKPNSQASQPNPFNLQPQEVIPQKTPVPEAVPAASADEKPLAASAKIQEEKAPVPIAPPNSFAPAGTKADFSSYQRPPEPEFSMPPDDQVTSFGTARRVSVSDSPVVTPAPSMVPAPEEDPLPAVTPLFSTGFRLPEKATAPATVAPETTTAAEIAVSSPATPAPAAATITIPAEPLPAALPQETPKKARVVIKSTMGKHTL